VCTQLLFDHSPGVYAAWLSDIPLKLRQVASEAHFSYRPGFKQQEKGSR
jgi:hypothetical protein